LVKALGVEEFARRVETEWSALAENYQPLTSEEIDRTKGFFSLPPYQAFSADHGQADINAHAQDNRAFNNWLVRNVRDHKMPGYASVTLSLKPTGVAPGDITDKQLEKIADLADQYSFGEARTTHEQNIVLADVEKEKLYELWQVLQANGFATPNIGTLTDMICCPGGDYCSLANAKSIPIAEDIQRHFDDLDYLYDLGPIDLNISGCMNACGHHHVGNIGILGVDKKGEEFYQVQLGGDAGSSTSLGKVLGPAFAQEEMSSVIQTLVETYVELRQPQEIFIDTYNRVGMAPFKERVYAQAD
jgi:sulfite reductase (NADPH) hemoprotein beta-component